MIQYTVTKTVYFRDLEDLDTHLDALVSSENMSKDTRMGLKTSGNSMKQTSVAGMPAMEVETIADMERVCMRTP